MEEKNIGPKFAIRKPTKLISRVQFLNVDETKYTPIASHRFRDESKERWIANAFKF